MSSFLKGSIFMLTLATIPPAIVLTSYTLKPSWILNLSVSTKTIWSALYAYVILYQFVFKFFTHPLRHLPTPPDCHWLLSQGIALLSRPAGAIQLRWMKETPNDGLILFRGFLHFQENFLLTKPETVMEVLNKNCYDWEKPAPARRFLARILGYGLISVEGEEHKMQRRNAQPAFSGRAIKDLVPLFWRKGISLADAVKKESAETGEIEISGLSSRVTLDIIGAAGIGKDFSTTENSEHDIAVQYARITDPKKGNIAVYFIVQLLFPRWLIRWMPLKANARVADGTIQIRRITKELLEEKQAKIQDEEKGTTDAKQQQKDIIAILMKGGKFTFDGLTDQLLTFLAAGHETTASALTWTMYLLGKHQGVQTRLRKECQAVAGSLSPDEITADIIDSMPYLDAVSHEVLRIYPTVPVTARRAVRQTRIGEHVIPKGSFAVICAWALNRLPDLWGPDAEEFRPERWLGPEGKNGGAVSPYAFVTFLHGPRSCIGQSFARYELKCLLAVMMLRYEVTLKKPDEMPVPEGTVTIRPRDGMELIVKETKQS